MMQKILVGICLVLISFCKKAAAQTELAPWGNITGIRVDGQLMEFETSLRVVKGDWSHITATGKERQRPKYERQNNQQIVTTTIGQLAFTEAVSDSGKGTARVTVEVQAKGNDPPGGIYFSVALPETYYAKGSIQADNNKAMPLSGSLEQLAGYVQHPVQTIRFVSPQRQLQLIFTEPTTLILKRESDKNGNHLQLYIPIQEGTLATGATAQKTITIKASGTIDKSPVVLQLNTKQVGRTFDGLGGNFRLQNPKTDPQVIDYCLQNLRVAWGRVEMPWRFWQPQEESNPIDSAKNGKLNPQVQHAMEMVQRLGKMGIPVILTTWTAPDWAIVGAAKFNPGPDGVWGNPLNHEKDTAIYKSITDYIIFLKEQYGVEVNFFSFNESDLGINIRQTGEEHAKLIKELGKYFASRGLKTKLLLGDNSDATTYAFIDPALNDPETYPYIGAVSFHSWRGCDKEILQKWADAASKINRPLVVGEGSIDAQAWGYPAIFEEPTYAREEINLYTRLLSICQPVSILQWQLTADYSPLAGGGIFGNNEPLRPTQRFWNLKQLASTPEGLKAMPITTNKTDVSCAALGDNEKQKYVFHLVNNGPTRKTILRGLPTSVKSLHIVVTDKQRNMQARTDVPVVKGQATFTLDATSYTTLTSK